MADLLQRRLDYDGLAGPYAAHRREDEAVVQALRDGADLHATTRVLEVGCGTGAYIGALHTATGCAAYGVDPSDEMLAIARQRQGNVSFQQGAAERLPLAGATVDLVFSVDVVHHLPDLSAACAEALRVLVGGGRSCTVTEDEDAIRGRVHSRYFPETVAVELERYPSLATVRASLARAGFLNVTEQRTASPYLVDDARPYAERAFSSLHLIADGAHRAGLARLEHDLRRGSVEAVSRAVLVWATRPRE